MENQNVNVNETVEVKENEIAQETKQEEVKMYTQEQIDEMFRKRLAREAKKIEEAKAEAERKAKLTEAEKLAEERKEFEAMRKQFEHEKRVNSTSKVLASNNLPIEFADFLIGDSDEATTQRVDLFKNAFNEALEKAVNERLRGRTPKASTSKALEITKEEFRKMSLQKQAQLRATKPELYKELTKR